MIQTSPITKTITTLADLEQRFKLSPTDNDLFFQEWQQDLPELTVEEKRKLDQIQGRFLRHRKQSYLTEGVVKKSHRL